jgi:pimeloyl-ACP methyl ester carboxylesterase
VRPCWRVARRCDLCFGDRARLLEVHRAVNVADKLVSIRVPTLVIHGELDAIIPVARAEMAARAIPNSKLLVIPGAGHVPVLTRPEVVVAAIDDWWHQAAT